MQQAHAREESYRGLTRVTALAIGLGVLAMASYSLQADDWPSGLSTFAVALTFAAAAAAVGCLVGFLFGIPRTLTDNPPRDPAGRVLPPSRDDDGDSPTEYRPNTNLEQISDWLTKILVGVGLVQIGTVFPRLQRLGDFIAPSMTGPASASRVFAAVLLVYFAIAGALLSYLWTVLLL